MRISRRTSGGRGEYEISEEFNGISPRALVGRRLVFDLGGGLVLDTNTELREQAGKLRIRRLGNGTVQIHRQVAAALLMPKPVRADDALGPGNPVLRQFKYAINHLHIRQVDLVGGDAVLQIATVDLRNQTYDAEEITVANRVIALSHAWSERHNLPDDLAQEMALHESYVTAGQSIGQPAEKVVERLDALLHEISDDFDVPYSRGTDALSVINDILNAVQPEPTVQLSDVDPEEPELRRRFIKEWKRWGNSRGAAGAKFKSAVRSAYNATCIICGEHWPSTAKNARPGVDAAHILPWSDYDLDHVSNGICLCKIHHWAFDEGLIRISGGQGQYLVWVPDDAKSYFVGEVPGFPLALLTQYEGVVPRERLPASQLDWPNRTYFDQLNKELDIA